VFYLCPSDHAAYDVVFVSVSFEHIPDFPFLFNEERADYNLLFTIGKKTAAVRDAFRLFSASCIKILQKAIIIHKMYKLRNGLGKTTRMYTSNE
jgi:hypothetical protein